MAIDDDTFYAAFPDVPRPPPELQEAEDAREHGLSKLTDRDVLRIEKALDDFRSSIDQQLGGIKEEQRSEDESKPNCLESLATYGGGLSTLVGFGWSIVTWEPADTTWTIGAVPGAIGVVCMVFGYRRKKNHVHAASRRRKRIRYLDRAGVRSERSRGIISGERGRRSLPAPVARPLL